MRPNHEIVSRQEWLNARKALLSLEKEETKLRDKVRAERLALPWVRVEKTYAFDTPQGRKTRGSDVSNSAIPPASSCDASRSPKQTSADAGRFSGATDCSAKRPAAESAHASA